MAEKVTGLIDLRIQSTGAERATDSVTRFADAADRAGIVEDKVTKIHERNERALVNIARQFDVNFRKVDNLARATEKLRRAEDAGLAGTQAHIAARSALAKAINDNAVAFSKLETSMQKASAIASGMSLFGGMTDSTGITSKLSSFLKVQKETLLKEAEQTGKELNARLVAGMASSGGMTDSTGITSKLSGFLKVQKEALLKEAEQTGVEMRARIVTGMASTGGMTDKTGITSKLSSFLKVQKETLLKEAEQTGKELNARLIAGMSSAGGMTDPTNMTRRMSASATQSAQAAKMGRATWANLSAQLQDVFVMTASGASPITTAVQQGPQIFDALKNSSAGLTGGLKELGSVALSVATSPITLITAAIGTAVAATVAWNNQVAALTVSLNGLGQQSGMTARQASRVAEAAAGGAGVSNREARGLAGQFLSSGVSGGSVGGAIGLTGQFSRGFGLSLEDAGKELASALADPARGADELAKKYGLVTFAEREHIKQVAALGDKSGATAKLVEALTTHLSRAQDATSAWGRILDRIGNRISNRFDKLGQELEVSLGGRKTFSEVFDPLRRASEAAKQFAVDREAERNKELTALREDAAFAVGAIQARTFAEREAVSAQRAYTEVFRQTNDAVKAGIAAETERAKLLAESARKVADLTRTSSDQARLSRMAPFERRLAEIDISERDFRRENVPSAVPTALNTTAGAAHNLTTALNEAAGAVSGKFSGRLIGPSGMQGGLTDDLARAREAIAAIESKGSGGYSAVGPRTRSGDRAYGRYQVMGSNVGPWTQDALGRSLSAREFLGDPAAQDAVFNRQFGRSMAQYRNMNDAASVWFTGRPRAQGARAKDVLGTTGAGYVGKFQSAMGGSDSLSAQTGGAFDAQRATANFEAMDKVLQDTNRGINEQRAALEAQTVAFGRSTEEIARASKAQELVNQFESQGIKITAELRAGIEATAYNYGQLAAESENAANTQRHLLEVMDTVRGSASEALGGMATDLAHGKRAADALTDALSRIGDRLIALAANQAIESLFGKMGSSTGGIFSAISGLFGSHAAGGVVGSASTHVRAPISAFIGAPHFAGGGVVPGGSGPVPIIAHAQELILNAAQQHNTAAAIARGQNDNRTVAAPVSVNLFGAPQGTKVQETRDSSGGRRIDIVMDERIAAAIGSPQGQEALQAANGVSRKVARR
jgi:hypothetical protein